MKFLKKFFDKFCYISTLIFLFSAIYCKIFYESGMQLKISYVFGVLGLSAIDSFLYNAFSTENEISKIKVIIYKVLFFLFVNISTFVTGIYLNWISISNIKMVIGMEVIVILVYAIVIAIEYYSNIQSANIMNQILKNRKLQSEK